jgi:hypothetical protein
MPPTPSGFYGDWRASVTSGDTRSLSRETGYSQNELIQGHLEQFMQMGGMEFEGREQHEMFREYLDFMVNGGHSVSERESFFAEMGIDPRDFDWEGWRELMGYSRD